MNLSDIFLIPWRSVKANVTRTTLATLGLAVGIAAIVSVFSIGEEGNRQVENELSKFGTGRLWIYPVKGYKLGEDDLERILSLNDKLIGAAANKLLSNISASGQTFIADIRGCTTSYAQIESLEVSSGRFFNSFEAERGANSAVIDMDMAEKLGALGRIGSIITIGGKRFNIVGITEGGTEYESSIVDGKCFIPLKAYSSVFNTQGVDELSLAGDQSDGMDQWAMRVIGANDSQLSILTLENEAKIAKRIAWIVTMVLGAVAVISMFAGGIGIMNVMLISVKERTREIGILKAIGATSHNILLQFLLESLIYSVGGLILGLMIGFTLASIASIVIGLSITVSVSTILLATAFSCTIGVIAGVYPAFKAAGLPPVAAFKS